MVKKFENMFSCFDIIPACDGQTDILPQHSLRVYRAWRAVKTTLCTSTKVSFIVVLAAGVDTTREQYQTLDNHWQTQE